MTEHAFVNRDPAVVALYLDACQKRRAQAQRIYADAATLFGGCPDQIMATGDSISAPQIHGFPQHGDLTPEGWRHVRGQLEPRRGKAGDDARAWLSDHQPVDVRGIMRDTGLPRNCSNGARISTPRIFHHDGAVWAHFLYDPAVPGVFSDGPCTWKPCKVSEWHAAREAFEAAEQEQP